MISPATSTTFLLAITNKNLKREKVDSLPSFLVLLKCCRAASQLLSRVRSVWIYRRPGVLALVCHLRGTFVKLCRRVQFYRTANYRVRRLRSQPFHQ